MKRFLLQLALAAAVAALLFQLVFGWAVPWVLAHSGDAHVERWTAFYREDSGAEGVVLGSSRALRGIDPRVLSRRLGTRFHNIAFLGMPLQNYGRFLHDYGLANRAPRWVVVSVDALALDFGDLMGGPFLLLDGIDHRSALLRETSQFEWMRRWRPLGFFDYKDAIFELAQTPEPSYGPDGFAPNDRHWAKPMAAMPPPQTTRVDTADAARHFARVRDEARALGAERVSVVLLPYFGLYWRSFTNRGEALETVRALCAQNGFDLVDLTGAPWADSSEYFYDPVHLTPAGSLKASQALADSLAALAGR